MRRAFSRVYSQLVSLRFVVVMGIVVHEVVIAVVVIKQLQLLCVRRARKQVSRGQLSVLLRLGSTGSGTRIVPGTPRGSGLRGRIVSAASVSVFLRALHNPAGEKRRNLCLRGLRGRGGVFGCPSSRRRIEGAARGPAGAALAVRAPRQACRQACVLGSLGAGFTGGVPLRSLPPRPPLRDLRQPPLPLDVVAAHPLHPQLLLCALRCAPP
mmetsp:Transcript_35312/g.83768  ORF Transcript_35312/g.83768 Transcript_35312/m.83768 type:complete len:211 (-) Transcript_35312:3902-4534(-)